MAEVYGCGLGDLNVMIEYVVLFSRRQIDLCNDLPLLWLGIRRVINSLFFLVLAKCIILHCEPY